MQTPRGVIVATHVFDRLDIHDVAFTTDDTRYASPCLARWTIDRPLKSSMILVASVRESVHGLKPSTSRAERRILGALNEVTVALYTC